MGPGFESQPRYLLGVIVGGPHYSERVDQEIIRQRQQGARLEEIAESCGCSRSYAHKVCRAAGVAIPYRRRSYLVPRITVKEVLNEFDAVTIERGAMGGYVATLDDAVTGPESTTVSAALRAALARQNI